MANISQAKGSYFFKFPAQNVKHVLSVIERLAEELEDSHYSTILDFSYDDPLTEISTDQNDPTQAHLHIYFIGNGRWNYANNIEWFKTDPALSGILSEIKGLKLEIEYIDYTHNIDPMAGYIPFGEGKALLTVSDTQEVNIIKNDLKIQPLTRELFLEYELGEESDFPNLIK